MRLTDATFRAADEFHIEQVQPILALMVREGYGFLERPVVRYELSENIISFIELQARAVTLSGRLIRLSFSREVNSRFQNITLPNTNEPVIIFIDKSSDIVLPQGESPDGVPLCDADYKILVKLESESYHNPDAVPLARFVFKRGYGWHKDDSFIAPCVILDANGSLRNLAANYRGELNSLINALKDAKDSAQGILVKTVVPWLMSVYIEVEKEDDSMSPCHFISLMQQVIQVLLTAAEMEDSIEVPQADRCKKFVESHYTPYSTDYMVKEGIELTNALIDLPSSFSAIVLPSLPATSESDTEHPVPPRYARGDGTRERKVRR